MKKKKVFVWVTAALLIIHIPFFLYLLNFRLIVFNENYYKGEFEKHGIYGKFPDKDIDKTNRDLLLYLKHGNAGNLIDSGFFTLEEKEHLLDVRNLVQRFILYFYIVIFDVVILSLVLFYLTKKGIKGYIPAILI